MPDPTSARPRDALFRSLAGAVDPLATRPDGIPETTGASTADPYATRDTLSSLPSPGPAPLQDWPRVAGYEILGELGRGGMGVVYKARQLSLNRLVALKMILAGAQAVPQEVQRFRSEAEAVARLQHPHIVHIYEIADHNGRPYFAMEFVEGGSLARRLHGTPRPAPEAAQLVETLARAVDAMHQRGVIHRDLKPANILLTAEGSPKIADFGLAKLLNAATGATQSGTILGTPSYMAPEQAGGKTRQIQPVTDVYALGAILYELLTGRPPFQAESPVDTVLQVLHEEPVPPTQLQSRVPRDLETICLKALAKTPSQRYASACDLADDLQRWQHGEPIRARRLSLWERARKGINRRPALAIVTALSAIAVSFLWVMTCETLAWLRQHQGRMPGAVTPDGQTVPAIRRALGLAFSPDGQRLAVSGAEGTVKILDARTRQEIVTLRGHTKTVTSVAFAANGTILASASSDQTVRLWELATGKEVRTLARHTDAVTAVAFCPDGRSLASASDDQTVMLWNPATGQALRTLRGHQAKIHCLGFSPDGQRLASGNGKMGELVYKTVAPTGLVKVWDVATGRVLQTLDHKGPVWSVAFSPDGRYLASASADQTVKVWEASTGHLIYHLTRYTDAVTSVAFSSDGRLLASACGCNVLVRMPTTGQDVFALPAHADTVGNVAFSPDGRRLASMSVDGSVKIWDPSTGQEVPLP